MIQYDHFEKYSYVIFHVEITMKQKVNTFDILNATFIIYVDENLMDW